jgi:predicted ATPase/DNA-binding SARP family transcriptional activator
LYLRLFGHPVLTTGSDEFPLSSERRFQLLAYLACRDAWIPREQLMALFWPGHPAEGARRNLRRLLHDVRQLPWLDGFQGHGDSLRWQVPTDLADFMRANANRDWHASIAAVSGVLLDGMEVNATEPFHEWLRYERELQLSRWRDSVESRRNEVRGDPRARVELSLHALGHDAHNEAAMLDLVEALRASGRDDEARNAYRDFAERLKKDLGVEPTLRLRSALAGEPPPAGRPPARENTQHGRATAGIELIGRRLEKAELVALLTREECRNLTIHGPGGVGKSSLARSSQPELGAAFPDGVFWVSLQDLKGVAQIPPRIAESCGFKLAVSQDSLESVANRIGASRMLLVFDNCEHLPEIRTLDNLLIERCPGLKILHTSRARIGSAGEWVLPLVGLPVPDAGEIDLEILRTFDAIRLFEVRALEIDPRFDLKPSVGDAVALVRTVEGLPLALELAAAWVRLLPLGEIVRDLERLLNLQNPKHAATDGQSSRERSLRASFDHSWQLLMPSEQSQLSRLAVFGGGFSLAAAHHVTGAELAVLGSLVDKSLVNATGRGRFSLHPLVRQFALGNLKDEDEVRHRHAAYFAQAMAARASAAGAASNSWSDEDDSNCIDAWQWATSRQRVSLLQQMAIPLIKIFSLYLRWPEGIEALGATLGTLKGKDGPTEFLRATLLYGVARCRLYNGELDIAEETARRSLRTCRSLQARDVATGTLHTIGYSLAWRGEMVPARRFLEQSLRRALMEDDAESIVQARYSVAFLDQVAGDWGNARSLHRQNEVLCREQRIYPWLALTLNGLGAICLAEKSLPGAVALFDEGIQICADFEVNLTRSFLMSNRGLALVRGGELAQAERSIAKALSEAQHWNVKTAFVEAHLARCCLALAQRDVAVALVHVKHAMAYARQIQSPLRQMSVVRNWGEWLLRSGDEAHGLAVLEFVRANAKTQQKDRILADEVIAAHSPSVRVRTAARKAAAAMSMDSLETEVRGASP